jgi:hypothetical protein
VDGHISEIAFGFRQIVSGKFKGLKMWKGKREREKKSQK